MPVRPTYGRRSEAGRGHDSVTPRLYIYLYSKPIVPTTLNHNLLKSDMTRRSRGMSDATVPSSYDSGTPFWSKTDLVSWPS